MPLFPVAGCILWGNNSGWLCMLSSQEMKISCSQPSNLNTSFPIQSDGNLIPVWLFSNVSDRKISSFDRRNFFPLILLTIINCQVKVFPGKLKAAESSLSAPTSPAPLVWGWLCAVQALTLKLVLFSLADVDNSHFFYFTVEHYGIEQNIICHSLIRWDSAINWIQRK